MSDSEYSDLDHESEFEVCCSRGARSCGITGACTLPFDPTSIENLILSVTDMFDFRVLMSDKKVQGAVLVTTGLSIAGALIGKHYGGKVGAAVGGAVGGACGLGVVAHTMREIWQDVKGKLAELFDIVYDYLAGLGFEDYRNAGKFIMQNSSNSAQLGMLILQFTSDALGKKIISNLSASI
ncbi:unnamed protein product [Leptosia nina]|uniref:Uncharacterized protein n=1 Tax=Leptosia nina TaxID=320188 RepID=A0AAV1JA28_9NEOP